MMAIFAEILRVLERLAVAMNEKDGHSVAALLSALVVAVDGMSF